MEATMQQILDAMAHMELRLTAALAGSGGEQVPESFSYATAPRYDDDVFDVSAAPAYDDNFSFDSFKGPTTTTTSSAAAPRYDDEPSPSTRLDPPSPFDPYSSVLPLPPAKVVGEPNCDEASPLPPVHDDRPDLFLQTGSCPECSRCLLLDHMALGYFPYAELAVAPTKCSMLVLNRGADEGGNFQSQHSTNSQLLEFTWGLTNSGYPFNILPDLVKGDSAVLPPEFASAVEGHALLTTWWPQEAALQHEKPDEQQQPELIQKELKQCYLSLEKGFNSLTVSQPGTLFHEAMKVRKRLGAIVDHISQDRREGPRERDLLLLAFILDSRETLTDAQISDNVIDVRFAAREATASVLTWMFMFLDDHTEFLKAVTEGVKAFESDLIAKANSFVHGGCVSELYHLAPIVCASVNRKTCMRACTTTSMADELVVSEEVDEVLNALPNRQPWPPPRQFAILADGVQVRPLPWPSFYCHAGGDYHGDVCITPPSVHGTNPASDAMVGMKIVAIVTDDKGYIHIEELRKAAEANKDTLAGDSPFSDATPAPTRLRRG
jgi:hypothetical protein